MRTEQRARGGAGPSNTRIEGKKWWALVVLGLALAIVIIDTTIVNVTIPSIRREFGASLRDVEWISAIYALVYAALIITWGRLGDQYGRRRIFVAGTVTFMIGSLVVGIAGNIPIILLGRVVQGVGAAMISPSTLSILSSTFTGRSRNIAFGVWGATAGAAGALGPLLGGWLTTSFDWRWAFLVNLPVGIVVAVGSYLVIQESKSDRQARGLDIPGILLAGFALAALTFGLIEGQTYGWWTPREQFALGGFTWPLDSLAITPVMFAISLALMAAFVFYETRLKARGGDPLFDFSLLRYKGFRFGLLTVLIVALGEFGVIFVLSIYLQVVRGLSAFDTGVFLLPLAVGSFFAAPAAAALSSRFSAKAVVTSGMVIEAISIFTLGRLVGPDTPLLNFVPVLLFYGVGVGLAIAQLTNITLSDIPKQFAGVGSGANNTVRQVGAAIGIAVLGAVLTAQISSSGKSALAADTTIPSFIKPAIAQSLDNGLSGESFQVGGDGQGQGQGQGQGGDPAIGTAIKHVVDVAITDGTSSAATVAAIFVLMGALSSLLIPRAHQAPEEERAATEASAHA